MPVSSHQSNSNFITPPEIIHSSKISIRKDEVNSIVIDDGLGKKKSMSIVDNILKEQAFSSLERNKKLSDNYVKVDQDKDEGIVNGSLTLNMPKSSEKQSKQKISKNYSLKSFIHYHFRCIFDCFSIQQYINQLEHKNTFVQYIFNEYLEEIC